MIMSNNTSSNYITKQNEYLAYFWAKIAADKGSEIAFDRLPKLMAYSEM